MLDIRVTTTGEERVRRVIAAVMAAMTDFRPIWAAFRPRLREIAIEQFATEGGRASKWAPLSVAYAARKAVTHPGRTVLVRDGNLAKSLISEHAPGAIWRETAETLEWGTDDPKAVFHQFGGRRLPRRQVIELTDADQRGLAALAAEAVVEVARRAGM